MNKKEIIELLQTNLDILIDWLEKQPKEIWEKGPSDKWTTGQHVLHLVNSFQLLNKALNFPRFFLKHKFGLCNRETRDYDTVVKNYQNKLKGNEDKARKFNSKLKKPSLKSRKKILRKLSLSNKKLQNKVRRRSDLNLDRLVIPHPLMGKMTIREIVMWSAYHLEHHTTILSEKYENL
ncbi:DinB family protein [Polaribacter sp.]|uniref:DinB family protein n=1 Tax=Polaribacter sp. TaxID=1920175 RepID=UPI0035C7C7E9